MGQKTYPRAFLKLNFKQGTVQETGVGLPGCETTCGDLIGISRGMRQSDQIDLDSLSHWQQHKN